MIRTARLDLVPGTVAMLRAELDGRAALAVALGARVPDDWPPELYDADAIRWTLAQLEAAGTTTADDGWGFYYFLLREPRPALAGCGGFKSAPDARGEIELGYAIATSHRRRRLATEAVRGLVDFAFTDPRVRIVFAQTIPSLPASIGVLERAGFRFAGEGSDPHAPDGEPVLRYEIFAQR